MTAQRDQLVSELAGKIGSSSLLQGEDIGEKYSVDWGGEDPHTPGLVVRPRDTQALSQVLAICHANHQSVVVQGGLTGLSGGSTPQRGEIAISLERMSGIEELDAASMTMTVHAGTPLQKIQDAAVEAGFTFPLDLGARGSCSIGGNVSTNAGGNQVIRYGMTRALVLGLEAVLADGTVLSSMNKMLKNNAGYDLKQLFIGTEGTLGVVTRIVLKLFPQMTSRCTALLALKGFDDVVTMLRRSASSFMGTVSSFEVMWSSYFDVAISQVCKDASPFETDYPLYVLLEVEGSDQRLDSERFEQVLFTAMEEGLVEDAVVAQSTKESELFWEIRDAIGELLTTMSPLANFDVGLPISKMQNFLTQVDTELSQSFPGIKVMVFGHLGDGNLHLVATTGRSDDTKRIYKTVYKLVGAHDGSVTAEHGVGTMKIPYLHYSRTPQEIALMELLKRTLDPKGILNVGRVVQP